MQTALLSYKMEALKADDKVTHLLMMLLSSLPAPAPPLAPPWAV